jgi:hypothetical protein
MKTLEFMNIKKEDILDREELRNTMAGCSTGTCVKCKGIHDTCRPVANCNTGTVKAKCGHDFDQNKTTCYPS